MSVMEKDRRVSARLEKDYQVFCCVGDKREISRSFDICEKGVGLLMNIALNPGDNVEVQIFPKDEFFSITCEGIVRHFRPASIDCLDFKYKVGVEFAEGLKDFAIDNLIDKNEQIFSRWSVTVEAGAQECYDVMCDLESFPKWQKTVKSVKVHERDSKSRPLIGEVNFDFFIRKISVVNKYEYFDKDFILSWKTIDGDIKAHEASYVFKQLRENRTSVTLSGFLIPGFYIPKRVLDYISNITIKNGVRELKNAVESGKLRKK